MVKIQLILGSVTAETFVVVRKERIHKENRTNRYAWPYAWGFTVDAYYQVRGLV